MEQLLRDEARQRAHILATAYVQLCLDTPDLKVSDAARRLCISLMSSKDMRRFDLCISGVTDDKILAILDEKICLNLRSLLIVELIKCRESLGHLTSYQLEELSTALQLDLIWNRNSGNRSIILDIPVLQELIGSMYSYNDSSVFVSLSKAHCPDGVELGSSATQTAVGKFIMDLAVCSVTGYFDKLPGISARHALVKLLELAIAIRQAIEYHQTEGKDPTLGYGDVQTLLKIASRRMQLGYSIDRSVLLALPLGATEDQVSPYLVHKTSDTYSAQVYADLLHAQF